MKKTMLTLTVVAALALTGSAFAKGGMGGPGMGPGMGPGCSSCCNQATTATPEQTAKYKKFVADTLPLKEEMHTKHMEIKKEWIKDKPDNDKIAKLQTELNVLQQKMLEARQKAGIPMARKGGKKGGHGMMGQGMGMGPGAAQPAPAQ